MGYVDLSHSTISIYVQLAFTCGIPARPFLFSCITFLCGSQRLLLVTHFCTMSHEFYHWETREQCNCRLHCLRRHPATHHPQSVKEAMGSLMIILHVIPVGIRERKSRQRSLWFIVLKWLPAVNLSCDWNLNWVIAIWCCLSDGKLKFVHIAARQRADWPYWNILPLSLRLQSL